MKYLYPDIISAAAADEEDANYPASYVLNEHARKPWMATSKDATLTLTVGGNADTIAIANTNALSVTVTVKNEAETETLWGPTEYDMSGINNFFEFFTQNGQRQTELWVTYDEQYTDHKVILDVEADTGEIVKIGKAAGGLAVTIPDPLLGVQEYLQDYSVKDQLASGGDYYVLGDIVSGFRCRVRMDRDKEFYMVMRRLAKLIGESNIFWRIVNADNVGFVVYGHFNGMPGGPHQYPKKSIANIDIIEGI